MFVLLNHALVFRSCYLQYCRLQVMLMEILALIGPLIMVRMEVTLLQTRHGNFKELVDLKMKYLEYCLIQTMMYQFIHILLQMSQEITNHLCKVCHIEVITNIFCVYITNFLLL